MFVYGLSGCGFESRCNHLNFRFREFFDIQGTIECGFTLKRVRDTTRTYNHGFELVTLKFELVTSRFEPVIHAFELVTRKVELLTHEFELVDLKS